MRLQHGEQLTPTPVLQITGERFSEVLGSKINFEFDEEEPDDESIFSRPGYTEPRRPRPQDKVETREVETIVPTHAPELVDAEAEYHSEPIDLDDDKTKSKRSSGLNKNYFVDEDGELKPIGNLEDDMSHLEKVKTPVYDARMCNPPPFLISLSTLPPYLAIYENAC